MSIYESTRFFTYGTICRICTFGNQQQKNPALKIFHCLQFSNFVNLRIYAVFHLWYNIQDMYIWKSTAKKSSFKNFSVCPISTILSIYESTRFFTYGTIFMICYFENQQLKREKNPALKIFQSLQFLIFFNLRIYAVFHLWYNIQDLLIWKSTTQQQNKSSFKHFSVSPILEFCQSTNLGGFHLWYNIQDMLI